MANCCSSELSDEQHCRRVSVGVCGSRVAIHLVGLAKQINRTTLVFRMPNCWPSLQLYDGGNIPWPTQLQKVMVSFSSRYRFDFVPVINSKPRTLYVDITSH